MQYLAQEMHDCGLVVEESYTDVAGVLNAIRDATGARITQTPATPTRVLAAIEALKNG